MILINCLSFSRNLIVLGKPPLEHEKRWDTNQEAETEELRRRKHDAILGWRSSCHGYLTQNHEYVPDANLCT